LTFQRFGCRLEEAHTTLYLSVVYHLTGNSSGAKEVLERTLKTYGEIGRHGDCANALKNLGQAYRDTGDHAEAVRLLERALELCQHLGHRLREADVLNELAFTHHTVRNDLTAIQMLERAIRIYQDEDHRYLGNANALKNLARARSSIGEYETAIQLLTASLEIYCAIGARFDQADVPNLLGDIHYSMRNLSEARAAWHESLSILEELNHPQMQSVRQKLTNTLHATPSEIGPEVAS